jgi:hypothetical protein
VLETVHSVLVIGFVAVTGSLLGLTLVHRMRVRSVVLTWRSPRTATRPVWPILFVGLVLILYVFAANAVPDVPGTIFGGYVAGGVLWLMSSLASGSVMVTDFGVVREFGKPGDAVAWMQVEDYFEATDDSRTIFVFIYEAENGQHRRLEVPVPAGHVDRFRRIVRAHVDDRIETPVTHTVGRKALEG